MGHRAVVAYERTDGQYTLHYSHWGAANLKLKHQISAESPFGGDDTDSKWAKQLLAELADGLEADSVDGYLAGEDRPSTVPVSRPSANSARSCFAHVESVSSPPNGVSAEIRCLSVRFAAPQ